MDWNAIYSAVGTAVVAVGGAVSWFLRREKQLAPLFQALGTSPHGKAAIADAQAALAAQNSTQRTAEIKAAVNQAFIAIKSPDLALTALEQPLLQSIVNETVPPAVRPYINVDTVSTAMKDLAAFVPVAQGNAWYKPVQDATQAQVQVQTAPTA